MRTSRFPLQQKLISEDKPMYEIEFNSTPVKIWAKFVDPHAVGGSRAAGPAGGPVLENPPKGDVFINGERISFPEQEG